MLMLPGGVKVFVATQFTDMRRSFNGLSMMVQEVLEQDPVSGALFVFTNRRKNKIKVLYWDKNGFAVWYKSLAKGVFRLPEKTGCESYPLSLTDLNLLLEGIELTNLNRFKEVHETLIN